MTALITPAVSAPSTARVFRGQTVAKKRNWSPRQRAALAVAWHLGYIQIAPPTLKRSAKVFRVSVPKVVEAIDDLKHSDIAAPFLIDSVWADLSADERQAFVRSQWLRRGILSISSPASAIAVPAVRWPWPWSQKTKRSPAGSSKRKTDADRSPDLGVQDRAAAEPRSRHPRKAGRVLLRREEAPRLQLREFRRDQLADLRRRHRHVARSPRLHVREGRASARAGAERAVHAAEEGGDAAEINILVGWRVRDAFGPRIAVPRRRNPF
jgi:hypothetical protein